MNDSIAQQVSSAPAHVDDNARTSRSGQLLAGWTIAIDGRLAQGLTAEDLRAFGAQVLSAKKFVEGFSKRNLGEPVYN